MRNLTYLIIFLFSFNTLAINFGNWSIGPKIGGFYGVASNDESFNGYALGPSLNYNFKNSSIGLDVLVTNYLDFSSERFNQSDFKGTDIGIAFTQRINKDGSLYLGFAPIANLESDGQVELATGEVVSELKLKGNVFKIGWLQDVGKNLFQLGLVYNYHKFETDTAGIDRQEGDAHFLYLLIFI